MTRRSSGLLVLALLCSIGGCMRLGGQAHVRPPNGLVTTRDFLLPGQREAKDYGLYSYLLFGQQPDASSEARFRSVIVEYLRVISDRESMAAAGFESWQLNITYLPLRSAPGPEVMAINAGSTPEQLNAAATWIIAAYDYPRARGLLSRVAEDIEVGPYLVSYKAPLSEVQLDQGYLFQDMTAAQPNLARLWMNTFMKQAAGERYWQEQSLDQWCLELRNLIATAAAVLPDVVAASQTLSQSIAVAKAD